jgi:hypothetical protein
MAVGVTVVERWGEWLAFSPEEFFLTGKRRRKPISSPMRSG